MEIVINDLSIEVVKKKIKNIHLGVYPPNGRVRVASPQRISEETLRLFLISKMSWINKQRAKFEGQARQSPREYISGESHYVEGSRYLMNLIPHVGKPKIELGHTHLDFYVKEGATIEQKQKIMLEWYRQKLKERAEPLIKQWEEKIGVQVHEWGTKLMQTKWGTCNIGARRIWLNVELAKKPLACLEYVIVHELVHLLERHHNDKFKAHMDNFLPNWRQTKEALNKFVL